MVLSLRARAKSSSGTSSRLSAKLTSKTTTEAPDASRLRSTSAYLSRGTGYSPMVLTLASSIPTTTIWGCGGLSLKSLSSGWTERLIAQLWGVASQAVCSTERANITTGTTSAIKTATAVPDVYQYRI